MDYKNMTNEEIIATDPKFISYVRTDRNGTRYFHSSRCEKCGGKGIIPYYGYVDGGICFDCGGTGHDKGRTIKVYTEEHEAKLTAQREARQAKKEAERKADFTANFKEKYGFGDENGELVIYRVAGNTFAIKDQLKEMGCKFNPTVGWFSAKSISVDNFTTQRMLVSDVCVVDMDACSVNWKNKDEVANLLIETQTNPSRWQGEVGGRLQRKLTIFKTFTGSGFRGGVSYMYLMKDEDGNLYKWNTSKYYQEKTYTFNFTVKELAEYKGVQQTVITRATLAKE